jgi:hypothetical protein
MFTRNWPRHLLSLSLSLPLAAMACGPDFPMRLLDNRGQSLAELPEGNFRFEVSRLGHAIAGLKPVTVATLVPGQSYGEVSEHAEQRDQAEQTGLTNEQQALVKQLRGLADARQVEAQGASLPAELRFYLATRWNWASPASAKRPEWLARSVTGIAPSNSMPRKTFWVRQWVTPR